MASPLTLFRRNQKLLLVIFGVLLMIGFTIGGAVNKFMASSAPAQNNGQAIVVSWNGGKLSERDMGQSIATRSQLTEFLTSVVQTAQQRGAELTTGFPFDISSVSEDGIVQTKLLAAKASDLGIIVDDDAVIDYLRRLSGNAVPQNELGAMLNTSTRGQMREFAMFQALGEALAARKVQEMATTSTFPISPAAMYGYYSRLNRRVQADMITLDVANYVDQVSESPSDAEVNQLYQDFKERLPFASSPDPGFRRPTRIAFSYVKADHNQFSKQIAEQLTDEEIQNYYEDNKSQFRKMSLPSSPAGSTPPSPAATDAPAQSAPDANDLDFDASSEQNSESEVDDNAESEGHDERGSGTQEAKDEDLYDESEEASGCGPQDNKAAADNEANDAAADDDVTETAASAAAADDSTAAAATEPSVSSSTVEYKPLEEVRQQIVDGLVYKKISEATKSAMDNVRQELDAYYRELLRANVSGDKPPVKPDFRKLAAENQLEYNELGLLDATQIGDTPLGDVVYLDFTGGQINRIGFVDVAFSGNAPLYQWRQISSMLSDPQADYGFWSTDRKESYVPELAEVRDEVVKAWKMKRATAVATKAAEDLLKQVRDGGKTLRDTFADGGTYEVVDTGEFSWMSYGNVTTGSTAPRLSVVNGLPFAGPKFMQDVFSLQPGGLITTTDFPQKTVALVNVVTETGSPSDMQAGFLRETETTYQTSQSLPMPLLSMAQNESRQLAANWYSDFEKSMNVQWTRPQRSLR